jgi:hypothetical protein
MDKVELSIGRKNPLTRQLWFSGINQAIRELLNDIDVSLAQNVKVSTSKDESIRYEGYRKFVRSDAKININGERKFNTLSIPVERKYLYGLPEIKGFNQTYFIDRYMPEIDIPTSSKVEINSKLIEKLVAAKNRFDINARDLIAQAIERKSARMRASGINDEPIAEPLRIDQDKNHYRSYESAFEQENL